MPPKEQGVGDTYKSMRYIMIGKNRTIVAGEQPQMNWIIDGNRSFSCVDLNRRIIDASMTLTDYKNTRERTTKVFDVIEFSDSEYSISTIRVKNNEIDGVSQSPEWKKIGHFSDVSSQHRQHRQHRQHLQH